MGLFVTALAVWLVIAAAPDTPIGRSLRRHLVERPAARLNRVTAGQLALIAVVIAMASLATWLGGGDGARMMGMALPDAATWLASAELTAYLDVAVAAVAAWSTLRTQRVVQTIAAAFTRRGAARPRSPASTRRSPPAGNDNADEHRRFVA